MAKTAEERKAARKLAQQKYRASQGKQAIAEINAKYRAIRTPE